MSVIAELRRIDVFPRRYFYPSLDTVQAYQGASDCPISQDVASRVLCLPIYSDLGDEIVVRICETINNMLS